MKKLLLYLLIIPTLASNAAVGTENYKALSPLEEDIFALATEPQISVANLDSALRKADEIQLTWDSQTTNTAGYIILYQAGSIAPSATILQDGTSLSGTTLDANVTGIEISPNTENSQLIVGLAALTEYSFTIVPFNITGVDVTTINYKTDDPSTISIFTLATEPTASVTGLTLNSKTTTTANFSINPYPYAAADNGGYVLYAEQGDMPRDISALEDGVSPANQSSVLGSLSIVEIDEDVTNLSLSGLMAGTQYTVNVILYNSGGTFETANYRIISPPEITFWTLSDPPDGKADGNNFVVNNITSTSVDLNWDDVTNANNYLILYSQNAADLDIADVTDGVAPASLTLPSGVNYKTSNSSEVSLNGLQANRPYTFWVIPYAQGTDPSTINYVTQTAPDAGTFTTDCAPPAAQSTFNTINPTDDIKPLNITVSWDNTLVNADRYLVVAREGNPVSFEPVIGTSYTTDVDSDYSSNAVNDISGGGNRAVYDGTGNTVIVTGLDLETEYHFAVFAYNSDGNCYVTPSSPGTASATTQGAATNGTVSFNSASTTINSVANDNSGGDFITVLDFNLIDGGTDGITTKLEFFTFDQSGSDGFVTEGWDEIIAEAQLVNATNNEVQAGVVNANSVTVDIASNQNDDATEIGFIEENTSEKFQLQIKLRDEITVAAIDNKSLIFELAPGNIVTEATSSKFDASSSSISSGDTNNKVEVIASEFTFIQEPAPTTINATENFTTAPQVEVTDENGNLDLDYTSGFTLSNSDNIPTQPSTLPNFNAGILTFPVNFNYQGSGDGTLSIIDATNSVAVATSDQITVNPKISLSEIASSYNDAFLEIGGINEIVIGFDITALGSAEFTELVVGVNQELSGKILNVRLFSSTDDTFESGDSNLGAGTIDNDGPNTTLSFSGLSENISSTSSFYFIVLDIEAAVPASTPDITFTIDENSFDFNGANVLFPSTTINKSYSFQDTTPPEIVSVIAQPTALADAENGNGNFQIIINFNEEMLADGSADPTITFPTEDPSNTIFFASGAWNVAGTSYSAIFNVTDANETVTDIDINVASAKDISDNTLVAVDEANLFSIDTENPSATLSLNSSLVNQPNKTIALTAEFGELMDTGTEPTVTISAPANFNTGSGSWVDNQNYEYTFTHNGNEEAIDDAVITISGALDAAGNTMTDTNSPLFDVNTVSPKIEAITASNTTGSYKVGDGPIEITLDFDEDINLGGTPNPRLILNSSVSAVATFSSHANDKITFTYTIAAGENADPLQVQSIDLNGATITSAISSNPADLGLQGNALSDDKTIVIDTESPVITTITSDTPDGIYGPGKTINIKVVFSEPIDQTGTAPTLTLNTGAEANFDNITNGNEINFSYTVGGLGLGENTNDLAVTSISASENVILDLVGNPSDLTLDGSNNNLATNKAIVIDTDRPGLTANPYSPENESFNVSLSETFSISLDEAVSGAGTSNIRILDFSDGSVLTTLDGASAFSNSNAATLSFNSFAAQLQQNSKYYLEFDEGAIVDQAGNALAAITGDSNWSFTTFGPARIDNFSVAACVGEVFTISGQYFTGVSEILIDVESGSPFEITTFSIDDDNTISFTVPAGTVPGKITLNKINGQDGNTDDASTTSATAIKIGPSSGQIVLVTSGTDVVCNQAGAESAPIETSIRFEIVGGSGNYTVEFTDGLNNFTESNYTTGESVVVNPPNAGANTYSIVSVVDEDPDLSGCSAPNNGTAVTITEFEQSQVEAGGTFDTALGVSTVSVCLAEVDRVDLSDAALMGTTPTVVGDITDGEWTIVNGPNTGGGGFSSNFNAKTSTSLTPTYYPSLADASLGSVTLRLTSDDPAAPNPCSRDFDEITIVFVNTVSITVGADINACIQPDGGGNPFVIEQLSATLGGGATSLEWQRVDQYNEEGSHDGTWGFAASENAATFSLTSTLEDPYYKASPQEIANGLATVSAQPTSGGCGGTPSPRELNININDLPNPSISLAPANVCSGETGVRFRMSPTSTSSTFEWTLSNEGPDSPGQNDKNQIDGSRTGNLLIVDFKEVTVATVETLTVKEINPITGCESALETLTVTINPPPEAVINYSGSSNLSNDADPILLQAALGGTIITEGVSFTGPGVFQDQNDLYKFDPSILTPTDLSDPQDDIIITMEYENALGCSNTDQIAFNIFPSGTQFNNLKDFFCNTEEAVTISINEDIIEGAFTVNSISGDGITFNGAAQNALFDPQSFSEITVPTTVSISYEITRDADPSNIISSSQSIIVYPLPELDYQGPEYDLCTNGEGADLEILEGNLEGTAQFTILTEGLPDNLIVNTAGGLQFIPAPLKAYLDNLGEESIEITMEYSYTDNLSCKNSEEFTFIVYNEPEAPSFNSVNLCNINGNIEEAIITNYRGDAPDRELEWYSSPNTIGQPIATGTSFRPSPQFFAGSSEVKFYVARRNINSSGEDNELCTSSLTEITYRALGIPQLTWNKSSFGDGPVVFTASHSETNVNDYSWNLSRITDNGLQLVLSQSITDLDNRELGVDFEPLGAGQYQIDFTINTLFACNTSISRQFIILPKDHTNSRYSYDFEDSQEGWVSSIGANNSWEWSAPGALSDIQTEGSFWITDANNAYNPGEQSYVYSPVMDLSAIDKPAVNFDLWVDVIDNVDGLILEYSTDGLIIEDPNKEWNLLGDFNNGISSGLNWYESTGIRSRPSSDNEGENNNIFGQGWSREIEGIVGKVEAKHALSELASTEFSNVIFRFQFKSNDNDGALPDGVAFDNFQIESLNRNVLVEYFGDEEAANDAEEMNTLAEEFNNRTSFSWINYRINETDALFEQNTSEMLSRMYQYEAYNASNNFAIDGVLRREYSFSSDEGKNDLRSSELVSSEVQLDMQLAQTSEDQLNIQVNYSGTVEFPASARLFIALLQKEITDGEQGTNPDKTYYNVLRTILPDVEGVNIAGNTEGLIETNFTASRPSDADSLLLVSFIQDVETGEVYQSTNIREVPTLSYSTVTAGKTLMAMGVQLYPNPARERLNLSFGNRLTEETALKVFDLTGKLIEDVELEKGIRNYELNTQEFKTGIYNVLISNAKGEHKMLKFAVTH